MFDVTLLVTLMADSPEELREASVLLRQEAAGIALALRDCYLEKSPAFRSTVPLGLCLIDRPRPLPTLVTCTTFPFTAGELLHDRGLLWGVNARTGNAGVVDPSRTPQPHMLFVAATRSGKCFTFKTLAAQLLLLDRDVLVSTPRRPSTTNASPAPSAGRTCALAWATRTA